MESNAAAFPRVKHEHPELGRHRAFNITDMKLGMLAMAALCAGCTPSGEEPGRDAPAGATADSAPAPDTAGWLEYSDGGIAFRYPPELGTTYIHTVDWPPMAQVVAGPLQCVEAGSETARAGRTSREAIGGRDYCVTRLSEGAAGSVYTQYAYAFEIDGSVAILTFSLRAVQCGNYDEPEKSACEAERTAFDPGVAVDRIARIARLLDP